MGDRTWAHITVLKEHAEEAARTLDIRPNERIPGMFCPAINTGGPVHIEEKLPYPTCYPAEIFELEEVNYGGEYECDALAAAFIPHDLIHGAGDDYPGGCSHVRFSDTGELLDYEYTEAQKETIRISTIEKCLIGPLTAEGIRARIQEHLDNIRDRTTPISWADQLENAAKAKVLAVITK